MKLKKERDAFLCVGTCFLAAFITGEDYSKFTRFALIFTSIVSFISAYISHRKYKKSLN